MEKDPPKSFFFLKDESDEPIALHTFQNKNYNVDEILDVLNNKEPMGGESFILAVFSHTQKKNFPDQSCKIAIGNNLLDIQGYDDERLHITNVFDRFRPCERMRKHAFAGQNTQQVKY